MEATTELLKKAALYRRLASIKTTGSSRADLILVEMAWRIERLVANAKQTNQSPAPEKSKP
jgi:hypothetical protein